MVQNSRGTYFTLKSCWYHTLSTNLALIVQSTMTHSTREYYICNRMLPSRTFHIVIRHSNKRNGRLLIEKGKKSLSSMSRNMRLDLGNPPYGINSQIQQCAF